MRAASLALAGILLVAGCDECRSGQQRCSGDRAQYCNDFNVAPFSHNSWSDFPEEANCAAVAGCTCRVESGSAVCRSPSPGVACPHPSCGTTVTGLVAVAALTMAAGRQRPRRRPGDGA